MVDYYFHQKVKEGAYLLVGTKSLAERVDDAIRYYNYGVQNAREVPNTAEITSARSELDQAVLDYRESEGDADRLQNVAYCYLELFYVTEKWYKTRSE